LWPSTLLASGRMSKSCIFRAEGTYREWKYITHFASSSGPPITARSRRFMRHAAPGTDSSQKAARKCRGTPRMH
jgi:hypothetical protein